MIKVVWCPLGLVQVYWTEDVDIKRVTDVLKLDLSRPSSELEWVTMGPYRSNGNYSAILTSAGGLKYRFFDLHDAVEWYPSPVPGAVGLLDPQYMSTEKGFPTYNEMMALFSTYHGWLEEQA